MKPPLPPWITGLADEDLQFIRRFVLASGSLKALAKEYGVSYPTLRSRLDRLIEKVRTLDQHANDDPFQRSVRLLVADGKVSSDTARELLRAHRAVINDKDSES